jgi:hypothetical protein
MPPHLLEILNYEGDEVYLLDVSSADGEARVLCREAGCDELRTSASSFAEFLRNELRS